MPNVGSIGRDLRALGSSAPLRAGYEASKRSGFHSVLFRSVRDRGIRSRPVGLGGTRPDSETAGKRCLEDAAAILQEGTRVFGQRTPTGVHASWNVDPLSGAAWPDEPKWWQIDIRSEDRLSDVKWVWEVARHRDLVVLARAAAIEPDGPWLHELQAMLRGWLEQCPPEHGVNWYSSLELALRAIAWAQVLELVGDELNDDVRAGMDLQLIASARHIMIELPYTVSSMKNNHLLGDGLGLVVLGKLFPQHPGSRRWQRIGDALFLKQLNRHMRAGGAMIEDSLSYHRFVLEMFIVRVLLGDAPAEVSGAMSAAAENLRQLGVLDGDVPQFGDWDEGRVLADSATAGSVAGAALAGLALTGRALPESAWDDYDEVAWYVPRPTSRMEPMPEVPAVRDAGYFQVVARGPWSVWFKSGTGPSHQHADITSVWIRHGDDWLIKDPGTGTYNGPLEVRNGFRTSSAHPVWRPAGKDQLVPHRAFRWLAAPTAVAAEPLETERGVLLLSWHDAFAADHGRVGRLVMVTDAGVSVHELIESPTRGELTIPLGDGATAAQIKGIDPDELAGQGDPFFGWHSDTYGAWNASTWLHLDAAPCEQLHWGVGDPEPLSCDVSWGDDSVAVAVTVDGHTHRVGATR